MSKLRTVPVDYPQAAGVLFENMAQILKTLRVKHGLSLRELAAATKIDHAYIYRIEQGIMENPSREKLETLIHALTNGPWLYK